MQVFASLINGLFIGIGVIFGMIGCLFFIVYKVKKQPIYDPADLVVSFERYLEKLIHEEWYEQRSEVLGIIESLKGGVLPPTVNMYTIKKDVAIQADNKSDITVFKIKKSYTVIERKTLKG